MRSYWAGGFGQDPENRKKLNDFITNDYWAGIYWAKDDKTKGARMAYENFKQIKKEDWFLIKGFQVSKGKRIVHVYYIGEVKQIDYKNHTIKLVKISDTAFIKDAPIGKDAGAWSYTLLKVARPDVIKDFFYQNSQPSNSEQNIEEKTLRNKKAIDLNKTKFGRIQKEAIHQEILIKEEHLQIQKAFGDYNKSLGYSVAYEEDYVDIKTIDRDGIITFYEIKPYTKAIQCIRESIGQLLEYRFNAKIKPTHLVAIGKSPLNKVSRDFLKEIQKQIPEFSYSQFDIKSSVLIKNQ